MSSHWDDRLSIRQGGLNKEGYMLSGLRILEKSPDGLENNDFQTESPQDKPDLVAEKGLGIDNVLDQLKSNFKTQEAEKVQLKQMAAEAKAAEEAAIKKSQEMQVRINKVQEEAKRTVEKLIGLDGILKNEEVHLKTVGDTLKLVMGEYERVKALIDEIRTPGEISEHDPILDKRGEVRPFKSFATKSDTQPLIRPEDLPKAA